MSGAQNNSEANFTDLALFFHLLKLIIQPAFLLSVNKYLFIKMKLLKVHLFTFYSLPHLISQYYGMNLSRNSIYLQHIRKL